MGGVEHQGHTWQATKQYPEGWVAWCSCGVGSPAKMTKKAAEDALRVHRHNPSVMPS